MKSSSWLLISAVIFVSASAQAEIFQCDGASKKEKVLTDVRGYFTCDSQRLQLTSGRPLDSTPPHTAVKFLVDWADNLTGHLISPSSNCTFNFVAYYSPPNGVYPKGSTPSQYSLTLELPFPYLIPPKQVLRGSNVYGEMITGTHGANDKYIATAETRVEGNGRKVSEFTLSETSTFQVCEDDGSTHQVINSRPLPDYLGLDNDSEGSGNIYTGKEGRYCIANPGKVFLDCGTCPGNPTLRVLISPDGSGTVTSGETPIPIIQCPNKVNLPDKGCNANYPQSTSVTLKALAKAGFNFAGWLVDGVSGVANCNTLGPCTVLMNINHIVTANFTAASEIPLTVGITRQGTGDGSITSVPTGITCGPGCTDPINCGAGCTHQFATNTQMTLTATPVAGSTFLGWVGSDLCVGVTTPTCTFVLSPSTVFAGRSAFASFSGAIYDLNLTKLGLGTVAAAGHFTCGAGCTGNSYKEAAGASLVIKATPAAGYTFSGWSGICTGTGDCNVTMDATHSLTATFILNTHLLSVAKAGTGTGTVTSSPAGINCGTTCSQNFTRNTQVVLTAAPTAGSTFTGWSGACTGTGTCSLTMDAAKSTTATFSLVTYPLTAIKTGDGNWSGTVTSVPAGINCGNDCTENYAPGTSVTLTATAGQGSSFLRWPNGFGNVCSGFSASCTVTVNTAMNAIAEFAGGAFPVLTVQKEGTGTGSVVSTPQLINCGSQCSNQYQGTGPVTLTATASSGSSFAGWSGPCTGTGTCSPDMSHSQTVTATFNSTTNYVALNVSRAGSGTGSVSSSPAGISCGATCSANYAQGTNVTLTPTATTGSTFAGWSGACTGTGLCVASMSESRNVTATFTTSAATYALTVSKSGSGSGTVTSSPGGITCGSDCSENYTQNTSVTLTAAPASGSSFSGWSGACTGASCVVTMSQSRAATATFEASNQDYIQLHVSVVNQTKISTQVNLPPPYVPLICFANSSCTHSYWFRKNAEVPVNVNPIMGSVMTGVCSTFSGACTVPMGESDQSLTVTFH